MKIRVIAKLLRYPSHDLYQHGEIYFLITSDRGEGLTSYELRWLQRHKWLR